MSNYRLVNGPASEPLTLSEAKESLFIVDSETAYDTYITNLITASREYVEGQIWRPLITQTWALNLDKDEVNSLIKNINKAPLQSVTSVQYYDTSNALQTLATSKYEVDIYSNPARFRLLEVPQVYDRFNTMQITFVCGYGSSSAVPKRIKQAMLMIIGHLFANRQDVVTGTQIHQVPDNSSKLLEPYRNNFIFQTI